MGIFFKKISVGLNISDNTVEVVELKKAGRQIKPMALSRISLEEGVVENGIIKDKDKLKKAIQEAFEKVGPQAFKNKRIYFSLPSNQVFLKILTLDWEEKKKKKDKEEWIRKKILQEIPLSEEDLYFTYHLSESGEREKYLITATSKKCAWGWQGFFKDLDLDVDNFDLEFLAVFRAVIKKPQKNSLIIDLGQTTTNLNFYYQREVAYTQTIHLAGDYFTSQIAQNLGISQEKAEAEKRKVSLKGNKKTSQVLSQSLQELIKETKNTLKHLEERDKQKIEQIFLIGGSSKIKGLTDFFTAELGIKTYLGNLYSLSSKIPVEYVEAAGSALKGLGVRGLDKGLEIPFVKREDKHSKKKSKKRFKKIKEKLPDLEKKKLIVELVVLFVILVLGVGSIYWAFQYRNRVEETKEGKTAVQIQEKYSQTQKIDLEIPVAITEDAYAPNRVQARTVYKIVSTDGEGEKILAEFKEDIENDLVAGEELWEEPLVFEKYLVGSTTEKFMVKWLVYPVRQVESLLLKKIKENSAGSEYILKEINIKSISPTNSGEIYYLNAEVVIQTDKLINF